MLTGVDPPGDSAPLEGVKVTPDRRVVVDQARFPCELAASPTTARHCHPPCVLGHSVFATKCVGVRVSGEASHDQWTCTVLLGPLKINGVVDEQTRLGMVILTAVVPPGRSVPEAGVKVRPCAP